VAFGYYGNMKVNGCIVPRKEHIRAAPAGQVQTEQGEAQEGRHKSQLSESMGMLGGFYGAES